MRPGRRQSAARSPPRVEPRRRSNARPARRAEIDAHSASLAAAVHGKSYIGRTAIGVSPLTPPVGPSLDESAVVRPQEIAPRDIEIAVIDEAAVALDQRRPIEPIEFWQLIPRQPVAQVMRRMEIVEQEQRPENPCVLDDRRAPLGLGHGAMFGERTHHGEARAGIDEAGDVNPKRHPADPDQPDQHRRAQDEVARESAARAALVAPRVARRSRRNARSESRARWSRARGASSARERLRARPDLGPANPISRSSSSSPGHRRDRSEFSSR